MLLESGAPLAVSLPVIEKDCLTGADEGAEMVRWVGFLAEVTVAMVRSGVASIIGEALQINNAQTTSTAATITTLFCANIPAHLERYTHTRTKMLLRAREYP